MNNRIKEFWGDSLQQVSLSDNLRVLLPTDTVTYLTEVGFPSNSQIYEEKQRYTAATMHNPSLLTSRTVDSVFPQFMLSTSPNLLEYEGQEWINIASSFSSTLGLGPSLRLGTGEVMFLQDPRPLYLAPDYPYRTIWYMNPNIEQFMNLLTIDMQYKRKLTEPTRRYIQAQIGIQIDRQVVSKARNEICSFIHEMGEDMWHADPVAFVDPGHFWRHYFETFYTDSCGVKASQDFFRKSSP